MIIVSAHYLLQEMATLLERFSSVRISLCEQEKCCRAILLLSDLIRKSVITENDPENLLNGFSEQHIFGLIKLNELIPDFDHDSRCPIIKSDIQETISYLTRMCK